MNHDNFLARCNECFRLLEEKPDLVLPLVITSRPMLNKYEKLFPEQTWTQWHREITWYLLNGDAWGCEYVEESQGQMNRILRGIGA